MAKKTTTTTEEVEIEINAPEIQKTEQVTFTPEQMEVISKMIASKSVKQSENEPISMYNVRDKKKIETVNVSRFDGKFVIAFKDQNNDPYEVTPKYYVTKHDLNRRLADVPYITLILSDGKESEEKEVALIDYLNHRKKHQAKVVHIDLQEIIEDHGLLGRIGADTAGMIDEKGRPVQAQAIRAQSKRTIRKFYVELPGFDKPVEFIEDFLA